MVDVLRIRIKATELAKLERAAKADARPLSTWARLQLLRIAESQRPSQ